MKLTEEQKNVIKAFMKFLIDPKEKFMIIQGPAGSGKTTMIKAMLEAMDKEFKLLKTLLCENQDESFNIKLTATTNKAVAVLRELSGDPSVGTVHSTLKLTLKKNFNTGLEDLVQTRSWCELYNTVLILDEASMLDTITFEYMKETLQGKSKAVLIGDIYQLAPVKQKESIMQKLLGRVPTTTLNTVMRHDGNILEAATAFREVVSSGSFEDILLSKDVIHIDGPVFKNEIEQAFLSPKYTPSKAKILTWSNDRVQEYNNHIRKIKGLGEQFQEGEVVVTNNPIISSGFIIPVDSEVRIDKIYEPTSLHGVPGNYIKTDNCIPCFLPEDYNKAKLLMKQLAKEANAKELKDKPNKRKQLWTTYFDIKNTWLDLRSQYASTVHKAQGSTYDEVFIDLYDIGRCNIPSDVARLLYVAISRAKNRVVLSGKLPDKYRSRIAA